MGYISKQQVHCETFKLSPVNLALLKCSLHIDPAVLLLYCASSAGLRRGHGDEENMHSILTGCVAPSRPASLKNIVCDAVCISITLSIGFDGNLSGRRPRVSCHLQRVSILQVML